MEWHARNRIEEGVLCIPIASKAMKHIEEKWSRKYKDEPKSVRLGLTMDGVNPFSNQTFNYSCWPIVIINFNIPPWMYIRKEHLMFVVIFPIQK